MSTKLTQEEVITGLNETVTEVTGAAPLSLELTATFADDLQIDSLTMVEVVVAVEERFDIRIPDSDFERLSTVGDAVAYVLAATDLETAK